MVKDVVGDLGLFEWVWGVFFSGGYLWEGGGRGR